jgi:hypothetical protein
MATVTQCRLRVSNYEGLPVRDLQLTANSGNYCGGRRCRLPQISAATPRPPIPRSRQLGRMRPGPAFCPGRSGRRIHGRRRGSAHRVPAQTLAGLAIRHDSAAPFIISNGTSASALGITQKGTSGAPRRCRSAASRSPSDSRIANLYRDL